VLLLAYGRGACCGVGIGGWGGGGGGGLGWSRGGGGWCAAWGGVDRVCSDDAWWRLGDGGGVRHEFIFGALIDGDVGVERSLVAELAEPHVAAGVGGEGDIGEAFFAELAGGIVEAAAVRDPVVEFGEIGVEWGGAVENAGGAGIVDVPEGDVGREAALEG
jgi:hypothetical protein